MALRVHLLFLLVFLFSIRQTAIPICQTQNNKITLTFFICLLHLVEQTDGPLKSGRIFFFCRARFLWPTSRSSGPGQKKSVFRLNQNNGKLVGSEGRAKKLHRNNKSIRDANIRRAACFFSSLASFRFGWRTSGESEARKPHSPRSLNQFDAPAERSVHLALTSEIHFHAHRRRLRNYESSRFWASRECPKQANDQPQCTSDRHLFVARRSAARRYCRLRDAQRTLIATCDAPANR